MKTVFLVVVTVVLSVGATLAVQTQQSRREPQFENEHVKVWKTTIAPNQPLRLHRHEHGRALIALKGGSLKVVDEAGKTIDTYVWEDGKAYWLDADAPGTQHGDLNEGPETMEVIVVELQK
jgi:quercetin dioxygenase-like cupin family protein